VRFDKWTYVIGGAAVAAAVVLGALTIFNCGGYDRRWWGPWPCISQVKTKVLPPAGRKSRGIPPDQAFYHAIDRAYGV
jgi:hypothetical protein